MKRYWLAMSVVLAAGGAAPAVECGDVLAGPASFRLERDLACATPPALTVRDGARLDLGHHVVTCARGGAGIAVEGVGASVSNGTITGCEVGVALSGEGHLVHRVRARFNGYGVLAAAAVHDVRLSGNRAEFNRVDGFRLAGDRNAVTRNTAAANGDAGIAVVGDGNVISRNRTNGNCIAGGCAAAYVAGGRGNQLARNLATGEQTGFLLAADSSETSVTRNRVRFSLVSGIVVARGATGNVLRGNVVRSNGTDLIDGNGGCAANAWSGNTFDSRSPGCLE